MPHKCKSVWLWTVALPSHRVQPGLPTRTIKKTKPGFNESPAPLPQSESIQAQIHCQFHPKAAQHRIPFSPGKWRVATWNVSHILVLPNPLSQHPKSYSSQSSTALWSIHKSPEFVSSWFSLKEVMWKWPLETAHGMWTRQEVTARAMTPKSH